MSTRDIEGTIQDIYGIKVSESSVSAITASIVEDIKQWQQKPLDSVYYIIWMDGIVMKVRHNGKVINKTIYLIVGVNKGGYKEVLGMWISETESASFWLSALNDLKGRGWKMCCSIVQIIWPASNRPSRLFFLRPSHSCALCIRSETLASMWSGKNGKNLWPI